MRTSKNLSDLSAHSSYLSQVAHRFFIWWPMAFTFVSCSFRFRVAVGFDESLSSSFYFRLPLNYFHRMSFRCCFPCPVHFFCPLSFSFPSHFRFRAMPLQFSGMAHDHKMIWPKPTTGQGCNKAKRIHIWSSPLQVI